jgi:hypothetical protein
MHSKKQRKLLLRASSIFDLTFSSSMITICAQLYWAGKKKPEELRKEHDTRNKQLLEGAFRGTLHLQMDYAYEQNVTTKQLVNIQAQLQTKIESLNHKVKNWRDLKVNLFFVAVKI